MELVFGHQLRGVSAKRLPWKEGPGGEELSWPGAGAVKALRLVGWLAAGWLAGLLAGSCLAGWLAGLGGVSIR